MCSSRPPEAEQSRNEGSIRVDAVNGGRFRPVDGDDERAFSDDGEDDLLRRNTSVFSITFPSPSRWMMSTPPTHPSKSATGPTCLARPGRRGSFL
jgi:hypothetical protein